MAQHKESQSGQASKGVGEANLRQHSPNSTGRGERGSAPDDSNRGVARGSTGSGPMSNESDRTSRHDTEAGSPGPGNPSESDEMPLTLGSNGGGRNDDQSPDTGSGGGPRGTEAHPQHRKAS